MNKAWNLAFAGIFLVLVSAMVSASVKQIDIYDYADGSSKTYENYDFELVPAGLSSEKKTECLSVSDFKPIDTPIKYYVNIDNELGLNQSFIFGYLDRAGISWTSAANKRIFDRNIRRTYTQEIISYDGLNRIGFKNFGNPELVAQTTLYIDSDEWKLLEFDMLFNSANSFGNAKKDAYVYDFQSVATHEFGHVLGFNDLTNPECRSSTMYLYSYIGQTKRGISQEERKAVKSIFKRN